MGEGYPCGGRGTLVGGGGTNLGQVTPSHFVCTLKHEVLCPQRDFAQLAWMSLFGQLTLTTEHKGYKWVGVLWNLSNRVYPY